MHLRDSHSPGLGQLVLHVPDVERSVRRGQQHRHPDEGPARLQHRGGEERPQRHGRQRQKGAMRRDDSNLFDECFIGYSATCRM